ncbi:multicopper oxidase domain-containing protein [Caulobacter segnis]
MKPGETFVYEFQVRQSGTYWYHSYSGLQGADGPLWPHRHRSSRRGPRRLRSRARGGALRLQPAAPASDLQEAQAAERAPSTISARPERTAGRQGSDPRRAAGLGQDADGPDRYLDVTGAAYTFLVNGHGPKDNWTALFLPGERVRLRFINAAAQSVFNVRIPGLRMTVVAADGQLVRPVEVDEFQIGNAETYDVIVQPTADQAFTIVSRVGRSLGPRSRDPRPAPGDERRSPAGSRAAADHHARHGHGHERHVQGRHGPRGHGPWRDGRFSPPGHGAVAAPARRRRMGKMDMGGMDMSMRNPDNAPHGQAWSRRPVDSPDADGSHRRARARAGERRSVGCWSIATSSPSSQIRTRAPPSARWRSNLTGNMERFIWGFDGRKFSERPPPYAFRSGER